MQHGVATGYPNQGEKTVRRHRCWCARVSGVRPNSGFWVWVTAIFVYLRHSCRCGCRFCGVWAALDKESLGVLDSGAGMVRTCERLFVKGLCPPSDIESGQLPGEVWGGRSLTSVVGQMLMPLCSVIGPGPSRQPTSDELQRCLATQT